MKSSVNCINLIKKFEGCRLQAYKCPSGVWTIGYGHTARVNQGMKITQDEAESWLRNDLKLYESHVNNNVEILLNQNQFDALVSFCYNCGIANLKTLVKNRTAKQISEKILLYNKSNGKILNGLAKRRQAEKELFDKV